MHEPKTAPCHASVHPAQPCCAQRRNGCCCAAQPRQGTMQACHEAADRGVHRGTTCSMHRATNDAQHATRSAQRTACNCNVQGCQRERTTCQSRLSRATEPTSDLVCEHVGDVLAEIADQCRADHHGRCQRGVPVGTRHVSRRLPCGAVPSVSSHDRCAVYDRSASYGTRALYATCACCTLCGWGAS
jgi:hypothetical protein